MTPYLKTPRLRLYGPHHRKFNIDYHMLWVGRGEAMRYSEQRHRVHNVFTQQAYLDSFDHELKHIWEISECYNDKNTGSLYDRPIGTISAYRDHLNNIADVGILLNPQVYGKGYGTEAWQAVCDWLLESGMRKVEAGAMETNTGMLKIFERTGMTIEGRREGHFMFEGSPVALIQAGRFK